MKIGERKWPMAEMRMVIRPRVRIRVGLKQEIREIWGHGCDDKWSNIIRQICISREASWSEERVACGISES